MNLEEFKTQTIEPTLVMISTKTCSPCNRMKPVFQEFGENCKTLLLDAHESREVSMEYQVHGVPTFLMMSEGEVVERTSGVKSIDQLQELFNKCQ